METEKKLNEGLTAELTDEELKQAAGGVIQVNKNKNRFPLGEYLCDVCGCKILTSSVWDPSSSSTTDYVKRMHEQKSPGCTGTVRKVR